MALLRNRSTQKTVIVEAELVVGRSPTAGLRIDSPYVSSHHAAMRWTGSVWQVRDLGSRNGTFLNGKPLLGSSTFEVHERDTLGFGDSSDCWDLINDSCPNAMFIPTDGSDPIVIDKDVIGLPSDAEPEMTAFRDIDGAWKLEGPDGQLDSIENGRNYAIAGRQWRVSFPEVVGPTHSLSDLSATIRVKLVFVVSRDEEHVEVIAHIGDRTISLGSRGHNYLLLTLARARLSDQQLGFPDGACGWVYLDELLQAMCMERTQLNIDIFRIRQHFGKAGLQEAINVIERRPATKQLRLGTSLLAIDVV